MTWLVLAQASNDMTDALAKGGPFALGAGAVLAMGRLGWIRFPPSPEQTADKARLEELTDDLISKQATALMDAIMATREVTKTVENATVAQTRAEAAANATTAELARLTAAASGVAQALDGRRER